MKSIILFVISTFCVAQIEAQMTLNASLNTPSQAAKEPAYSGINGHSHNDYAQKYPFKTAFDAGMGSIEADVYLVNNNLFVAHHASEIEPSRTLDSLYLKPLIANIRSGEMYPLSILIDIKSDAETTLQEVVRQIGQYPDVFNEKSLVQFVISGNRPKPDKWSSYPKYILFDGRPSEEYTEAQWERVGMVSDNFKNYIGPKKLDISHPAVSSKLSELVKKIHDKGKKVRFWDTTDDKGVWSTLVKVGVDYINTDTPEALKAYLETIETMKGE